MRKKINGDGHDARGYNWPVAPGAHGGCEKARDAARAFSLNGDLDIVCGRAFSLDTLLHVNEQQKAHLRDQIARARLERDGVTEDADGRKLPGRDADLTAEDRLLVAVTRYALAHPPQPVGVEVALADEYDYDEPWHGTAGGYRYKGCRCARCITASREAGRDAERRRTARMSPEQLEARRARRREYRARRSTATTQAAAA